MVRLTRQACAQIGRLATPTPDKLGVTVEDKAKDFFREVMPVLFSPPALSLSSIDHGLEITCFS